MGREHPRAGVMCSTVHASHSRVHAACSLGPRSAEAATRSGTLEEKGRCIDLNPGFSWGFFIYSLVLLKEEALVDLLYAWVT